MAEDEDDDSGVGEKSARFTAGALVSTAGLVAANYIPPELAIMATGGMAPVIDQMVVAGNRKAQKVLKLSMEFAGLTADELAAWADSSEDRGTLVFSVVEAAWRSADEAKIRALARVLAFSFEDDARLDLAPLYVSALRAMEPAHVTVLRQMSEAPPREEGHRGDWTTEALALEHPALVDGMHYIVATLDRVGCIEFGTSAYGEDPWWEITHFGRGCLGYLRDVDSAA